MTEIDITFQTLRTHAKGIVTGVVMGCLVAVSITFLQPPTWRAEMIIAPTERTGVPSLSSFLPQTGADAPALQYFVERIDASHSTDFTVFETLITAPAIIQQVDPTMIPTDGDSRLWLDRHLSIRPVGMTQFRRITLTDTHKDKLIPLLNTLYHLTDKTIRNDKKAKTARRITYLNTELENVRHPDHRDAIIALLKEQEQTAMMAEIDAAFAADIIQPATLLPKPVAPNPSIIFPIAIFIGGFIGFIISGLLRKP